MNVWESVFVGHNKNSRLHSINSIQVKQATNKRLTNMKHTAKSSCRYPNKSLQYGENGYKSSQDWKTDENQKK